MARQTERLSPGKVAKATGSAGKTTLLADGNGLYLRIGPGGAKSWVLRYMVGRKSHDMGLGSLALVGLREAREHALQQRRLLRLEGIDPIRKRRAARQAVMIEAASAMTFKNCAEAYIAAHKTGWKNPKHAAQWPSTLQTYVYPVFGDLPVQAIDVGLVTKAVEPIWATKPETASRVRGRIESVLDWATVRGYRQGENPARWRGHLEKLLPARRKVAAVPRSIGLSRATSIYGRSSSARRGRGARARICYSHSGQDRRSPWHPLVGNRPGKPSMDGSRRPYEGRARASSATQRCCVGDPEPARSDWRSCISRSTARPVPVQHGAVDAPPTYGQRRSYCARVPINLL